MVALRALKKVREPLRQGGEADGRLKPRKTGICTVCRNIDISRGVTSAPPHWLLCHVSCSQVILTQFQNNYKANAKPTVCKNIDINKPYY